jgi:hypothetical protein
MSGLVGIAGAEEVRVSVEGNKSDPLPDGPLERRSPSLCGRRRTQRERTSARASDITVDLSFEELKPAVRMVGKEPSCPPATAW